MKKKVTALCLCVALLAVAVVGASLAYFTDTKSATNTFTVGNVKIDLIESKYHREGNDNSGDTSIPDPTHKVVADDGMKYVTTGHTMFTNDEIKADAAQYSDYIGKHGSNMVPGRNFAKCPYVINTGANDAYIRIRVMIPHDGDVDNGGIINAMFCSTATSSGEFQQGANGVNWPVVEANGYTDENGLKYDVYTFTRTEPLKAGAMTEWNVWNFVGIGKNVTNADIEKAIEKGVITKTETGALSLNVLVQADAIQAEGFADAAAAWAAFK
ncbi:MAG TPA: hypothetical protein DE176_02050 [Clostridiales bacterium]|nr:hypothetical protein [Clostridiales bacterium]